MVISEMVSVTVEVTSNCVCEDYNEDTGETTPSNDCFGCWQDSLELLRESIIDPWAEANDYYDDTDVRISGTAIGWRRLAGYKDTTVKDLVEALTLNGDFTLVFKLENNAITVMRYSHDEPTGASFTIGLTPEEDEDN